MHRRYLIALLCLVPLAAFAKKPPPPQPVIESAIQTLAPPPADSAQIVFVEPINKIQGLFPVGIFELVNEERTLIAASWWKGKTVVLVPPGKHLFFATIGFGLGHRLEANVEAGKRYYVLLRFIYAQGFQMRPIRNAGASDYRTTSADFPLWLKETRFVEKTAEADAYFGPANARMFKNVDKAQTASLAAWQAKTAAEAAELTLNPEDAVAP